LEYVVDTVGIIRYVSSSGRIGKKALKVLENADLGNTNLAISVVSLMEIMYLSNNKRIHFTLQDFLLKINNNSNYQIVDLTKEILLISDGLKSTNLELHDKLIISTAIFLDVPILSSDEKIIDSNVVKVIWD